MTFKEQVESTENEGAKKIGDYLLTRDDLKEKLENPKKSLDECFIYCASQYIKKAMKVKGASFHFNGDTDEAVYGHAVHYYDEDDIKIDTRLLENIKIESKVSKPKDTEEVNVKAVKNKKKKEKVANNQLSLFDL